MTEKNPEKSNNINVSFASTVSLVAQENKQHSLYYFAIASEDIITHQRKMISGFFYDLFFCF